MRMQYVFKDLDFQKEHFAIISRNLSMLFCSICKSTCKSNAHCSLLNAVLILWNCFSFYFNLCFNFAHKMKQNVIQAILWRFSDQRKATFEVLSNSGKSRNRRRSFPCIFSFFLRYFYTLAHCKLNRIIFYDIKKN